jgi:hypothetical protein
VLRQSQRLSTQDSRKEAGLRDWLAKIKPSIKGILTDQMTGLAIASCIHAHSKRGMLRSIGLQRPGLGSYLVRDNTRSQLIMNPTGKSTSKLLHFFHSLTDASRAQTTTLILHSLPVCPCFLYEICPIAAFIFFARDLDTDTALLK